MRIRPALIALLFAAGLLAPSFAQAENVAPQPSECLGYYGIFPGVLKMPQSAWEEESAAVAAASMLKQAEKGNMQAQRIAAFNYARGYGVEQNYSEAFKWMKAAAENSLNGSPDVIARYCLGTFYETGTGVAQDAAQAYAWYEKLQYYPFASLRLAAMQRTGRGTEKDAARAVNTCRDALLGASDYPSVPSLHILWQDCMSMLAGMPPADQHRIKEAIEKKSAKLKAAKKFSCPELSDVRVIPMQTEPQKDGVRRPSEDAYTFHVPAAYLSELDRRSGPRSMLSLSASFDTLEPYCSDIAEDSYNFHAGKGSLHLYLTRGSTPDKVVSSYIDLPKNTEQWREADNRHYPKYKHFFKFKAKGAGWRDIFVPRENELGQPYVIECMARAEGGILCKLHTSYKGKFHVAADFDSHHLDDIHGVHRKITELLDRFSRLQQ